MTPVRSAFHTHMARPSKAHPFTIYEDAGIPTPESEYGRRLGENATPGDDDVFVEEGPLERGEWHDEEIPDGVDGDEEGEGDRRQSAMTRTSISSLPESTYQTEKPYTPPVIRPSFMRPESVRRMQMSSPPPYRSPRQSVLRHSRSRTGTPQSVRSAQARGSPRPRRHVSEESAESEQEETKHHPLVLLHVTLLPVVLPWSGEALQELLPGSVLESLQLLRSKVSALVAERGLLIPHPREEYELLEDRLLEALELQEERITKCGHFRPDRHSVGSSASLAEESDSGLGSSVESFAPDGEVCGTCHHKIHTQGSGIGKGKRKWSIKVYAANGLMRAPAWAAAWNEMESVDVEILPWVDDETRKLLDARMERDMAEQDRRVHEAEAEAMRMRPVAAASPSPTLARQPKRQEMYDRTPEQSRAIGTTRDTRPKIPERTSTSPKTAADDLPQIYKPSQIPLSVLLKNYIFLLAQDWRNVVIFFLALLAVWFGMRGGGGGALKTAALTPEVGVVEPAKYYEPGVLTLAQVGEASETAAAEAERTSDAGTLTSQSGLEAGLIYEKVREAEPDTVERPVEAEQSLEESAEMLADAV